MKCKILVFTILLFLIYQIVLASFERSALVPEIAARGNATIAEPIGRSNFLFNPASSPKNPHAVSIAHTRPFQIADFSESMISYATKMYIDTFSRSISIGFGWQSLNAESYAEHRTAIAIGFGDRWRFGGRVDLFRVAIENFEDRTKIGGTIGGIFRLNENLHTAIVVASPRREIVLGVSVQPEKDLSIAIDFRRAEFDQFCVGAMYRLSENLEIHFGTHNAPLESAIGFSFGLRKFEIDYAWIYHPILDGTHQFAINFHF